MRCERVAGVGSRPDAGIIKKPTGRHGWEGWKVTQPRCLRPAREDVLCLWPVDKKVGNVRNDGPDLIERIVEREPTLL